jgi:hypothetical protein
MKKLLLALTLLWPVGAVATNNDTTLTERIF